MAARQTALAANFSKFHRAPRSNNPEAVQLQATTATECIPQLSKRVCSVPSVGTAPGFADLNGLATMMESMGVGTETETRSMFVGTEIDTEI